MRVMFMGSTFPVWRPSYGLWTGGFGESLGIPSWFTTMVRLPAAAFPCLRVSNFGVVCNFTPSSSQSRLPILSWQCFTDQLLPVAFPSLILVQALITSHTHLHSPNILFPVYNFSSHCFFSLPLHTESSSWSIISITTLFQQLPISSNPSSGSSAPKPPLTARTIYLLYSWTSLQPSKRPDTMSIQCYNICLIQSTLSNLQLIIWMFCLQDAKHLDWLKKFITLMEVVFFFFLKLNWPDVLALCRHNAVSYICLNSLSAQPSLHQECDLYSQCHVLFSFQIVVKIPSDLRHFYINLTKLISWSILAST